MTDFATARPVTRGRMRYDWWRAHHGWPQHAKWRSVARTAKVPVSVAFHIVACLLDCGSRSNPRGSIADFKPFDCAGIVDSPVEQVDRVLAVLKDIHWIDGHMIADWDERQPQREDQGAADRKARQRAHDPPMSHDVTHSKRDNPECHAMEVGQAVTNGNVTNVSAPDKDKDITSSLPSTAREERVLTSEVGLGARSAAARERAAGRIEFLRTNKRA